MNRQFVISLSVFCMIVWGCASGHKSASLEKMPPDAPVQNVLITGENCDWSPDRITVPRGAHVVLNVRSVDRDYNFRLTKYDLSLKIPKGETVNADFYASEAGEFEFGCYIEEGQHYYWGGMVGKLIVE